VLIKCQAHTPARAPLSSIVRRLRLVNLQAPAAGTPDWYALRDLVLGSASVSPNDEALRALPQHLQAHPLAVLVSRFIATRDERLLDQAGRALAGVDNWYVALAKS
jgi:hypothetical protein